MKGKLKKIFNKSIGKKAASIMVATSILVTGVPFTPFEGLLTISETTFAADTETIYNDILDKTWYNKDTKVATITNMSQFAEYSRAYHSHAEKHNKDRIVFTIKGTNTELVDYIGLGTASKPFEGTLELNLGSGNLFQTSVPFFEHISDNAKIINSSNANTPLRIARTVDNQGTPLFANHIYHFVDSETGTEGNANWKVEVCTFDVVDVDDNNNVINNSYSFAGIIGDMNADSSVTLDVTDNTSSNIVANSGDVGYFCGKMLDGSKLTVNTFSGSNSNYSITASGHAGGIIGSMTNGSQLTLKCAMLNETPNISSGSKSFAGGLVGRNSSSTIINQTGSAYPVGGVITGGKGAGGLFGYYRPVYDSNNQYTYDISDYSFDTGTTVNGTGSIGGLFGVLENMNFTGMDTSGETPSEILTNGHITINTTDNSLNSVSAKHTSGNMNNFGGYIGYYTPYSKNSTLKFDNVSASMEKDDSSTFDKGYGGAIGTISSAAYVQFDGFTLSKATNPSSSGNFGGLVGDAGNSFIDTNATDERTISISSGSFIGGGLVGKFEDGVLRLKGTTTLSGTTCAGGGQIVGERDDTLIFAESDWKLSRKASPDEYDDIGSWGEVIRFHTSTGDEDTVPEFLQSSVLSVNDSTHIVSVKEAVTTISSKEDFARAAICFSIDIGETGSGESRDGNPWLTVVDSDEDGTSLDHSTIVNTDLTLDAEIDLHYTGLTGLTRDNGDDKITYSGVFDGGDHSITLAIGDTSVGFNSNIYRHEKNGLFGMLTSHTDNEEVIDGEIKNTIFDGSINIKAKSSNGVFTGAAASQASGNIKITDASVKTVFNINGTSDITLGRLIGEADSNIGDITISNTEQSSTNHNGIDYGEYSGDVTGENSGTGSCFGGVIGKIDHSGSNTVSWEIDDITLSGTISNTSTKDYQRLGGLIACISNASTNNRSLTLNDITLDELVITEEATKIAGGLLGYTWYNVNVDVNGVTVTDGEVSVTGTGTNVDLGGIVYCATGKWTIPSGGLNMDGAKITASGAGSFGMIINKGWHNPTSTNNFFTADDSSAIYLLLTATDSYDCNDAAITLPGSLIYDELVAFSAYYDTDENGVRQYSDSDGDPYILKNGNGVISIKTDGGTLNMSGSGESKTYTAQTTKGSYLNKWSRYYYNLDVSTDINASTNPDSPQKKLMRWGLNQYAHSSIKSNFTNPFGTNNEFTLYNGDTASNSYSMAGYSWYPVDVDTSVKVQGAFEFANDEFEACESVRSSLEQTQHYMMQEGLFRNVNCTTVTLGNTTWRGSVSRLKTPYNTDEYGTGALVFGKIYGEQGSTATITSKNGNIVLDGIHICNVDSFTANGAYAPLLINKAGNYSTLIIHNVSVKDTGSSSSPASWYKTNLSSSYAGTSLIGNVGLSTSAVNENLEFLYVKLDARGNRNDFTAAQNTELDKIYPTSQSIFSKSTLLNRFMYASDSDGSYNYDYPEDWNKEDDGLDENNEPKYKYTHNGNVTYGSELNDSTVRNQWYGDEHWYHGQDHGTGYLTSPWSGSVTGTAANAVDFSYFRPYVFDACTKATLNTNKTHQLKVNHGSSTLTGCGTYNDPYSISDGDFETIANIINGSSTDGTIRLPDRESGITLFNTHWDTKGDKQYKWDSADSKFRTFTVSDDVITFTGSGYSQADVRKYLAGAYYKLADNITLSSSFTGLGAITNTTDTYAIFRGVIIGDGKTITNNSNMPLIATSYGSVIKGIIIDVDNLEIEKSQTSATFSVNNNNQAYGAVIGQIMGGDNIIDNVQVRFYDKDNPSTVKGKIKLTGSNTHQIPVGGYVGVVVDGALIFRNMEGYRGQASIKGLTDSNVIDSSNKAIKMDSTKYLYVNPIVGRVLNGYAVTETDTYRPFETGIRTYPNDDSVGSSSNHVTMENSIKNYSIADIDSGDTGKITVGDFTNTGMSSGYYKSDVILEDAQALFLFAALIQSKSTQSSTPASPAMNGAYGLYKTAHMGTYEQVGNDDPGSSKPANLDHPFYLSENDGDSSLAKPYIINKYVTGNGIYAVTNNKSVLNIQLGPNNQGTPTTPFYLPDGFKGIGSYLVNNNYVSLFEFNGQGNTVSMNSSLNYYYKDNENYKVSSSDTDAAGFGFFNYLRQNRTDAGYSTSATGATGKAYQIHDLRISGNIELETYGINGNAITRTIGNLGSTDTTANKIAYVGGLAGYGGLTLGSHFILKNVSMNNLAVKSVRCSGGLFGYLNCTSGSNSQSAKIYNCSADYLDVSAGKLSGGMIGLLGTKTTTTINGDIDNSGNNSAFLLNSINITSNRTDSTNRGFYGGGLIANYGSSTTVSNIDIGRIDSTSYKGTIGNSDRSLDYVDSNVSEYVTTSRYKPYSIVGGIAGANPRNNTSSFIITNCNIYNVNIYGGFVGGMVGRPENEVKVYNSDVITTQTPTSDALNSYMLEGYYAVGGIIGEGRHKKTIDGCVVENYVIRTYCKDNDSCAGGLLGRNFLSTSDAYVKNCAVKRCYIEGYENGNASAAQNGIGAIAGLNHTILNGYNILVDDVKFLVDESTSPALDYAKIGSSNKLPNGYIYGSYDQSQDRGTGVDIIGFTLHLSDDNDYVTQPWAPNCDPVPAHKNNANHPGQPIVNTIIYADYSNANSSESTRSNYFSPVNSINNVVNDKLDCLGSITITQKKTVFTPTGGSATTKIEITDFSLGAKVDEDEEIRPTGDNGWSAGVTTSDENGLTTVYTRTYVINYYDNTPYVTSANKLMIDSKNFLTGDAIASLNYDDSVAKLIVDQALMENKPVKYYQSVKLSFPSSIGKDDTATHELTALPTEDEATAIMQKYPSLFVENGMPLTQESYPNYGTIYLNMLNSKFKTFQDATEHKTKVNTNFPVLILDDSSRFVTTELLNNYLRILTNSDYNFADTSSTYFTVNFAKCTWNNSNKTFEFDWDNANLSITDDGYFKIASTYDNANTDGQFTLVDVAFNDPSNGGVAYHLYVPVFVRKMMKFDFECSALSGTAYSVDPYEEVRSNMLIENLEMPVTLQFRWIYKRSLSEWIKQIEGGENLLTTFTGKKLNVDENNRAAVNDTHLGFPNADMVLIDANNYNQSYYATKSTAYSSGELDLMSFRNIDGQNFSSIDFNDFFNITIVNSTGENVIKCVYLGNTKTSASTIKSSDGGYYRPYTDEDSSISPSNIKYLKFEFKPGMTCGEGTEVYLKEDYYISFFTKKESADDSSIYNLVFESPKRLDQNTPNDLDADGQTNLFLGNIYSNTFSLSERETANTLLNTGSNTIGATFTAEIEIDEASKDIVVGWLGIDSINIYQSFLVYFDKTFLENSSISDSIGIKSEPTVNITSYIIDTENVSGLGIDKNGDTDGGVNITNKFNKLDSTHYDPICAISVDNGTITGNYIELRNNENLREYLNASNGEMIKIKAVFTLSYDGEDEDDTKNKIISQFSLRDQTEELPSGVEIDEIGSVFMGSSNISPSNVATAYSKTVDEGSGQIKYYTELKSGGALIYNSDDSSNSNGTYAQLGINAWNESDTSFPMKTLLTYNTKNIDKANTADRMELTLKLYPKSHYGTGELPIAQYIKKDTLKVYNNTTSNRQSLPNPSDPDDSLTSYSYNISSPMTSLKYENDIYTIPIDFSVYTGGNDKFEGATVIDPETSKDVHYKYYSNYMVKAEIKLYAGNNLLSTDSDYVIYTNAKIYSDWISLP
ncbi:MAG: hypothetical protein IKW87_12765 [Ruminococcus sp.]|nr:hypothetical protein [Ruminococcus sp.]